MRGIYKNIKNNMLYSVIGLARSTNNPNVQIVVYEQLYNNRLRNTNIILGQGSVWTRDLDEFNNKFTLVFNVYGMNNIVNKDIISINNIFNFNL